ncbi:glycosyltransferase family 2 protein [Nocardia yamanashiensis]|uniref:glycosyltransferase family 2 protein n=1 Tax=Nocardia yamanashiensis TaxID=209247 RepID=UPI0008299412|nr:glycosyltransferase family 2 protein [Nocardia yamanashiensis]
MENKSRPIVLSVVIPVLNERTNILSTLERLVVQDAIDQIVVVDNGSTDGTHTMVAQYGMTHPKVDLVHEPVRGIAQARNTGFDRAAGEFIARVDADTIVGPEWGAVVRDYFTDNPDVAALTGITTYFDSPVGFLLRFGLWLQIKRGKLGGPVGNLQGANMAIRRSAWEQVREDVSTRPGVIDDLDLALCLSKRRLPMMLLTQLRAQTSARRRHTSLRRWWQYQQSGLQTIVDQGFEVLPIHQIFIRMAWLAHAVQYPIYRFWDFEKRRYTWRRPSARILVLDEKQPRQAEAA